MKLLHLTFHFEYAEPIEEILDRHEIVNFARYPMIEGGDREGKHYGTQVHLGNVTVVQAQIREEKIAPLFEDVRRFRDEKPAHHHIEAVILPIEQRM